MLTAQQLIAHRGLQARYPENTLLAIKKAAEAGAKHIECDIQLSSDGVYFLCHDRSLERISGIEQCIADVSAEQLLKTQAPEAGRFGTMYQFVYLTPLSDVLAFAEEHADIHFYLELKRGALISHGLAYCLETLAQQIKHLDNITVISFDQQAIQSAKEYGIKKAGIVLEHWHEKDEIIANCAADIAYINKLHIHGDEPISAAVPIAIYEVDDIAEAKALLARGASLIETFKIDKLLASG
jgi:glycerophosphoryl diester phosphodiesterase